jgi:hypothetical protein
MRQTVRDWRMHRHTPLTLENLAQQCNPIIQRWWNYYGTFYQRPPLELFHYVDNKLKMVTPRMFVEQPWRLISVGQWRRVPSGDFGGSARAQRPSRNGTGRQVMRARSCLLFLAAIAAGCAVTGTPFQRAEAPSGNAIIYVYRPYHYGSSLLRPSVTSVTCGNETARIGAGGYHAFVVPAGKVVCSLEWWDRRRDEIDAAAHVYYIREEFGWRWLTGHPHLNPIDTDAAHDEIQTCCVSEATPTQSLFCLSHWQLAQRIAKVGVTRIRCRCIE